MLVWCVYCIKNDSPKGPSSLITQAKSGYRRGITENSAPVRISGSCSRRIPRTTPSQPPCLHLPQRKGSMAWAVADVERSHIWDLGMLPRSSQFGSSNSLLATKNSLFRIDISNIGRRPNRPICWHFPIKVRARRLKFPVFFPVSRELPWRPVHMGLAPLPTCRWSPQACLHS